MKQNINKVDNSTKKLLAAFKAQSLIDEKGEIKWNQEYKLEESRILDFAKLLLKGLMPITHIKEFCQGFKVGKYYFGGIKNMYDSAQLQQIIQLYNKLKDKIPLFEIGTKRATKELVQKTIEKFLGRKLDKIGRALVYSSGYNLFEDKQTGIFLSTYINYEEHWLMTNKEGNEVGSIVTSSSYIGIIVPDYKLSYQLAKALAKAGCDEIEWPFNRLGGISISDLTKKNVTPEEAKKNYNNKNLPHEDKYAFMIKAKRIPQVKKIFQQS